MTGGTTTTTPTVRPEGKPGPTSQIVAGFTYTPQTPDTRATGTWTPTSPAGEVLHYLPAGIELAADRAGLHRQTIRNWIDRGQTLLAEADCDGSLEGYAATDPPAESLAYVAFSLTVARQETAPVVEAVMTIHRASTTAESDEITVAQIRAADVMLKRHPKAKAFRPDPRLELTGAGGGPIEVSDRDGAKAALAAAAARLADAVEAKVGEPTEPEERTHDGPDVPPVT